jgi:hypothetical protein
MMVIFPQIHALVPTGPNVIAECTSDVRENVDAYVTERDVLSGGGGRGHNHEGNRRYRKIITEYASRYRDRYDHEHNNFISEAIVNGILAQGGRFLRTETGGRSWRVMEFREAKSYVRQALRGIARCEEG